jgi:hypothetical protein
MDTPCIPQHTDSPRHAFNGLIFVLMIVAVGCGAFAGWMRYSKKRACGFADAAQQAMGGMLPEFSLAGGLTPAAGAACQFICPQCGSYCMTQSRAGCPICPFCKQAMVPEVTGIQPVANLAAGIAAPIPVQAGVKATHDNRGACTNCHTVVRTANGALAPAIQAGIASPHRNRGECTACHAVMRTGGLGQVSMITADAVAPHANRGTCGNCHVVAQLNAAALNAAANAAALTPAATAAPPIPADAVKPILIKPFGLEVCPAPGDGAEVTGVMGTSNASKAGLVAGDIIVECNGKKVADAKGLEQLVLAAAPEANAQLRVLRNGRIQKVAIMVGEGEMEGFTPIPVPKP